jgi:hypothetical protein
LKTKTDLFKSGYSEKWRVAPGFDVNRAKDKDYAFSCMLPEKTAEVANLKDEKEYFTE